MTRGHSRYTGRSEHRDLPHAVVIAIILVISVLFGFLFELGCRCVERWRYPRKYTAYVEAYAAQYDVPEHLIYAVIRTESGFDSAAESTAGAVGLMQLMPETFEELTRDHLHEYLEDGMRYDPETSIRYGTYYLSRLYLQFGRWDLALAAYNAGPGNVNKWLADPELADGEGGLEKIPVRETRKYVSRVQKAWDVYDTLYDQEK